MTRNAAIATRSVEMFLVVAAAGLLLWIAGLADGTDITLTAACAAVITTLQQVFGLTVLGVHDGDGRTVPPGVGH